MRTTRSSMGGHIVVYTIEVTALELEALIDALKKGASRHESYVKFYKDRKSNKTHELFANTMRKLNARLERLAA